MLLKIAVVIALATILSAAFGAPQSNQLASQWAQGAASGNSPVGKPQFHLNGGGSGNNGRNWAAGGNAGVGVKAWQSQNGRHSLGVGANYGQSAGRFQGQSWRSRPDIGVGAGYTYRFRG